MSTPRPVVTLTFGPATDDVVQALGSGVEVRSTAGVADDDERARMLGDSDVLFCWNLGRELRAGEGPGLPARLVQLISAGADHVPFDEVPSGAVVAGNVGAYAEPMAEHVLAMALALVKRLPQNHAKMASGIWDQGLTRWLAGSVCGIVGFGGIGQATARRMQALGVKIHAINTSGKTDEPVEWIGTLDDLDTLLGAADVVVLSVPLTRRTRGLISTPQLAVMKPGAVLVNVGRGELVDQDALYDHLRRNPDFSAGIDTWWGEPFRGGQFHVERPFFEMTNLLGSPHNSGMAPGVIESAISAAAANIRRFLNGGEVTGIVRPEDYVGP